MPYSYNHYLWPLLVSALFFGWLGIHARKHQRAPGALPFMIMVAFAIPWTLSQALLLAATHPAVKIFWFKLEKALILPIASAALCFVIEYAGLRKWLNRGSITVLIMAPMLFALLVVTNDSHHLVWTLVRVDRGVQTHIGPIHALAIGYGFFLGLIQSIALIWLFWRSPRHRWIAAGLLSALVIIRAAALLNVSGHNPIEPLNPMAFALNLALLPYALAFFRFNMFSVAPVARHTAVDRIAEALMVLDTENRIADLNETAKTLFAAPGRKAIGRPAQSVLKLFPDMLAALLDPDLSQREIESGSPPRWFQLSASDLLDHRKFNLGRLVWIQDISARKQRQAQLLTQQAGLTKLKERERLARELHDGTGQILAAIQLQLTAATELLDQKKDSAASACLRRAKELTQMAKQSIRAYLNDVSTQASPPVDFWQALRRNVTDFSQDQAFPIQLTVAAEAASQPIDAALADQLLPIVREALINARKHAQTAGARVTATIDNNQLRVSIEDAGQGFDPVSPTTYEGFGLRSMRGRAEAIGGSLDIQATPGAGTRITVYLPCTRICHESSVGR